MGKKQKRKPQCKRRQRQLHKKKVSRPQEESLPVDIVREILVRCPLKTLARFRCVCKQWGSIISQPTFQEDHHCRNTRANPCVLLTRCETKTKTIRRRETKTKIKTRISTLHISTYTSEGTLINSFSKTDLPRGRYIPIDSCRGLVCLGPIFGVAPILICNPSTEELIALPPTEGKHICIGFGYAATTKDFKVVRFFRHPEFPDTEMCCQVFTLGTSGWREVRNPPQYPPNFFEWGAPFLHGALHMLAVLGDDFGRIDAFDIEKEAYTKFPLPEFVHTMKRSSLRATSLIELQGSLCLTFDFMTHLEFWSLRDYHNKEWVKKYSINLESLGWDPSVDPLKVMADGIMLLSIQLDDEPASLYYYNFRDKSFTKDTKLNNSGTLYVENLMQLGSKQ